MWGQPSECWPPALGDRVSGLIGPRARGALREWLGEAQPGRRGALKAPLYMRGVT